MKLRFCVICGTNKDLEHHHIIPKVNGGDDHQHNFLTLCHDHHDWIHNIRRSKLNSESFSNLVKQGIKRRRAKGDWNGGRPQLDYFKEMEVCKLWKEGKSYRQIRNETGVALATIKRISETYDLPPKQSLGNRNRNHEM